MRRLFLQSAAAALLAASLITPAVAADAPIKVVYHLSEGLDQASRALGNIRNHLKDDPTAKIVVVTHGEGIKFLLEGAVDRNNAPYSAAVGALVSAGVQFKVCNNTLQARNIPKEKVLLEASIVPAGVVEVARLQAREGYAYIHP